MDRNGKKPKAARPRDSERSDVKAKSRSGLGASAPTSRAEGADRPGRPGTKPKPSKSAP
jgi:hypothetical protein